MSKLGPHLRHNRHHILLHMEEQPCSQFVLHMHDQQHMIYICISIFCISLYDLTTCLFIGFTIRKTLNIGTQKWLHIHAHGIMLHSTPGQVYQSTTSRPSLGL
jgi:hypothetical protein